MKKIAIVLLGLLLMMGCAMNGGVSPPPRPPGCEKSVLYDNLQQPQTVLSFASLGFYELAKQKPEIKAPAIKAINATSLALANKTLTYVGFFQIMSAQFKLINSKYSVECMILVDAISGINKPAYEIPLSDCDRALLRDWLAKTKMYLELSS